MIIIDKDKEFLFGNDSAGYKMTRLDPPLSYHHSRFIPLTYNFLCMLHAGVAYQMNIAS